jgi:hypothetical protein
MKQKTLSITITGGNKKDREMLGQFLGSNFYDNNIDSHKNYVSTMDPYAFLDTDNIDVSIHI